MSPKVAYTVTQVFVAADKCKKLVKARRWIKAF
jgi:hypothetical protein